MMTKNAMWLKLREQGPPTKIRRWKKNVVHCKGRRKLRDRQKRSKQSGGDHEGI